ncbi:MAG TPA: 30S ribosome-binding factor RbfA [bacterium]|jgi:ribosome-binding factor A|nr:30S ribosome-binding factor RbfA [bacterium]HOH66935.1 30S ribosome-binding factor RbfA [bacterium]HQA63514.1 30S ribosome-binding factor RbfA [bacterium]
MPDRMVRVNELIGQQLGLIINEEVEFPLNTIVTITAVSVSKDLHWAKVLVSVIPKEQKRVALKILAAEAINLQKILNERVVLRRVPKLQFSLDETQDRVGAINELLDNLDI